jgi:formate hydrogenlyase subunit 3/multisubunit Na+/H+ antiporter MnhD subunit
MWDPSSPVLWVIWGAITIVFVALLIYRSVIGMKEDDQIFLDQAEATLEAEQKEILTRPQQLGPYLKVFGAASAVVLVLILGLWIYPALKEFFGT